MLIILKVNVNLIYSPVGLSIITNGGIFIIKYFMSKQVIGRTFIGTLNNPAQAYPDIQVQDYLEAWRTKAGAEYVTGQLERGKEGTPHVQFFVQWKKPTKKAITALKKHCKFAHFEIVKVNNGADDYCNKEDTRLEGPWEFGLKPARKNVKGDTRRRNEQLLEMGTAKAVEEGYIKIEDAPKLEKAL